MSLRALLFLLLIIGSTVSQAADDCLVNLHPPYLKVLHEMVWRDRSTSYIYQDLDKPVPAARLLELKPRWKKIEEAATQFDWLALHFENERSRISNSLQTDYGKTVLFKNWQLADQKMRALVFTHAPLTEAHIIELNQLVRDGPKSLLRFLGPYRTENAGEQYFLNNRRRFQVAMEPRDIKDSMDLFFIWYQETDLKVGVLDGQIHPIDFAAQVYQRLISIHPFTDGNGRTTRLVLDWVLLSHHLPPAIFADLSDAYAVIFPYDQLGRNPAPGDVQLRVTEAIEHTLTLLRKSTQ